MSYEEQADASAVYAIRIMDLEKELETARGQRRIAWEQLEACEQKNETLLQEVERLRGELAAAMKSVDANWITHQQIVAERQRSNEIVNNAVNILSSGCPVDHKSDPIEAFSGCIICERQRSRKFYVHLRDLTGRVRPGVEAAPWVVKELVEILAAGEVKE